MGVYNFTTAKSSLISTPSGSLSASDFGNVTPTKSLPTGVTAYIPTEVTVTTQTQGIPIIVAEMVDMGSLDISGASGTFTDGLSMGTKTEGGTVSNLYSSVMVEVATVLNATPGNFTVTYIDQDGNAGEVTTTHTLTASALAGSGSWLSLNLSDCGVRDITAASRSAGTTPTGVLKFWGIKPICVVPSGGPNVAPFSMLNNGIIRRLPAGANIMLIYAGTLASGVFANIKIVGDN